MTVILQNFDAEVVDLTAEKKAVCHQTFSVLSLAVLSVSSIAGFQLSFKKTAPLHGIRSRVRTFLCRPLYFSLAVRFSPSSLSPDCKQPIEPQLLFFFSLI